ncbi:hypothetical protein DFP73DRAFT_537947 [Morchella snyderi]|nr:hypothetical protein DFP73DRAFT_537947 [Morchella snyderi]
MMTESTQHKASDGSEIPFDGPRAPANPPATKEAPAVVSADTASDSHSVVTDSEPRLLHRDDIEDLPINERTCLLQNYGILLESGVQEVGNSVKVFDYSVEHIDDGQSDPKAEKHEITIRETDKQAEVSLDSVVVLKNFRDQLWHNPDPNNIYLRVMDFPNIKKATQEFLPNAEKMIQKEIKNNIYKMCYDKNKMSTVIKISVPPDDIGVVQNSSLGKTKGVDNFGDSYKNRDYSGISIQDKDADSKLVGYAEKRAKEEMKQFRKILIPENLPTLKSSIPVFFNCSDEGQTLVLGVSLPYFSLGTFVKEDEPESFGLSKYMSLGRDQNKLESEDNLVSISPETNLKEARVHKALLMVFNNEMIAIFRSKEDGQSGRPPPLFRHQERHGAYRSLITIISNILKCPQKKIFNFFEDKLCEQQYKVTYRMSVRLSTPTDGLGMISNLQSLNTDISALNIVVKSQIEILKELRQIYENTFYQENIYDRNAIKIPLLWEMKEQIGPALLTIDKIIGERNLFYENLNDLVKGVRKLQKSFSSFIKVEMATNSANGVQNAIQDLGDVKIPQQTTTIVNAIQIQTQETGKTQTHITNAQTIRNGEHLETQTKAVIRQHDIIQKQARVMTALMFITMVFLPLSFFASYLGMNEGWVHRARSEHTIFWAISAPITLVIGVLTCWFDHVYEDWPRKWRERWNSLRGEDDADPEKATSARSTDPTGPQN